MKHRKVKLDREEKEILNAFESGKLLSVSNVESEKMRLRKKALPFEPLIPNEETIEAMKSTRRGEVVAIGNVNNLLANLNEDKDN